MAIDIKFKKIFPSCSMAVLAFFLGACTDSIASPEEDLSTGSEEYVEVNFSVDLDQDILPTRAIGDNEVISTGKEIDRLTFAVYNDHYSLQSQYGNNIYGQHVAAKSGYREDYTYFSPDEPYKVKLRLIRGRTYHIVFWAQSSKTNAYDTSDFEEVKVDYTGALANDEYRDAFCKVESFSVSEQYGSQERKVTLMRPFAQINVGTTGADLENNIANDSRLLAGKIRMSKITLKNVAQKFNVLKDEIDNVNLTDATFDYNTIPSSDPSPMQEYLKVDLNQDGKYEPYTTSFPTLNSDGTPRTEHFKYLAMCYVLVPASKIPVTDAGDVSSTTDNPQTVYSSSVIEELSVSFINNRDDPTEASVTLTNVPAMRNWRTNIIGGMSRSSRGSSVLDPPGRMGAPAEGTGSFDLF